MRTVAVLSLAGVVLLHALPDLPGPLVWMAAIAALMPFYHVRA